MACQCCWVCVGVAYPSISSPAQAGNGGRQYIPPYLTSTYHWEHSGDRSGRHQSIPPQSLGGCALARYAPLTFMLTNRKMTSLQNQMSISSPQREHFHNYAVFPAQENLKTIRDSENKKNPHMNDICKIRMLCELGSVTNQNSMIHLATTVYLFLPDFNL